MELKGAFDAAMRWSTHAAASYTCTASILLICYRTCLTSYTVRDEKHVILYFILIVTLELIMFLLVCVHSVCHYSDAQTLH